MLINPYRYATGGAADAYAAEVMADTPVGYWKCGEVSGALQDSSGNGNHLTMTGSPTYGAAGIPGSPETSIDFSAAGMYASVTPLPAVLQLTTWTLEGWYYSNDGNPDQGCILTEAYAGDLRIRYMLGGFDRSAANRCDGGFHAAGTWRTATDPTVVTSGAWHHFVVTYDGITVRLYRNGVQVQTLAAAPPADLGNEALYVARKWDSTASVKGRLAHLAIYSGDLGATRIGDHYTAGS